jgi:hypothetical protein
VSERKKKKRRDINELAKEIVEKSTSAEDSPEVDNAPESEEGPKAKAGRKGGLKGGPQRAENLTPAERSEIARKAALARWKKKPSD